MKSVEDQLLEFQTDDPEGKERCGLILDGDRIIELENVAEDPVKDFSTRPEDVAQYIDEAWATWHTHPGGDSQLTNEDYHTFAAFKDFNHFIVGADKVSRYVEKDGAILNA